MKLNVSALLCLFILCVFSSSAQTIYYVNSATGNDTNPGTSWALSYRNVTKALTAAKASSATEVQIWIAAGTYSPLDGLAVMPADPSDTSFTFYRGNGVGKALKVYGGFVGTESSIAMRDALHPTYLDGVLPTGNSYHVATIAGLATTADSIVLDRLTIQNGIANGRNTKVYNGVVIRRNGGGGLYIANNATPKIAVRDCKFNVNNATGPDNTCLSSAGTLGGLAYGGGVYVDTTDAVFIACNFTDNSAKGNNGGCNLSSGSAFGFGGHGYGGGLYASASDIILANCTFSSNVARGGDGLNAYLGSSGTGGSGLGGALYLSACSPSITNCSFTNNGAFGGNGLGSAGYGGNSYGGGIFCDASTPICSNNSFVANKVFQGKGKAEYYGRACGGALFNNNSSYTVNNCGFSYNRATDSSISGSFSRGFEQGGAVYNNSSNPSFVNCSLTYNEARTIHYATAVGGAIFNDHSAPQFSNCIISFNSMYVQGHNSGTPLSGGVGMYNETSAPVITNCVFDQNRYTTPVSVPFYGGAIDNQNGSNVTVYNCSFTECGTNDFNSGGGAIHNSSSTFSIRKCSFVSNNAYSGGAISSDAYGVIDSTTFVQNTATYGGAINQTNSKLRPTNSQFHKNKASFEGGAIYIAGSAASFYSYGNIYVSNVAGDNGGAISYSMCATCTDTLVNNVFALNKTLSSSSIDGFGGALSMVGSRHVVYNNTFYADSTKSRGGAICIGGTGGILQAANNIFYKCYGVLSGNDTSNTGTNTLTFFNNLYSSTNPLFINTALPAGADTIWGTADDGLSLQTCSPAVNTGSNAYLIPGETTDIINHNRVNSIAVDLGAYEAQLVANITGSANICVGSTATMTDSTSGGTWSSSDPTVATINSSGIVTGVSQGAAVISYAVSLGCTSSVATRIINVARPASVITGSSTICAGTTTSLTDTTIAGSWSSSAPTVGAIATDGTFTGLSQGSTTVTYSVTNVCGTSNAVKTITVQRTAAIILGADSLCRGTTATLTDSTTGGAWSSSNMSVATITSTGALSTLSQGTTTVSYSVTNVCGTTSSTKIVKVQRPVAVISGIDSVCVGATVTLTDSVSGGTWTSGGLVATISSTGIVTAVAQGVDTITYTVSNACGPSTATKIVRVHRTASPISGIFSVCVGSSVTLTDSATGGTWIASSPIAATISAAGIVMGMAQGSSMVTYTVTNACGVTSDTAFVTVHSPTTAIIGADSLCVGATVSLSNSAVGGTWSSGSTGIATVSSSGVVTGANAGTTIITYALTNACGSTAAIIGVTVDATAASITGRDTVCQNETITLGNAVPGGTWSSSNVGVASVSGGLVTGLVPGTASISYSITNACGISHAAVSITVLSKEVCDAMTEIRQIVASNIRIYPNPATHTIYIDAPFKVQVRVEEIDGRVLGQYKQTTTIDIERFPVGMLMLYICDENSALIETRKVVKLQ